MASNRIQFAFACSLLVFLLGCSKGNRQEIGSGEELLSQSSNLAAAISNATFWSAYSQRIIIMINAKRRLNVKVEGIQGAVVVVRLVGAKTVSGEQLRDMYSLRNHQVFLAACHLAVILKRPTEALEVLRELKGIVDKDEVIEAASMNIDQTIIVFQRNLEGKINEDEQKLLSDNAYQADGLLHLYQGRD